MGILDNKPTTLMAAWHMYTTRSASAYDAMAAFLSCGGNVGTMSVEWLWKEIHELGVPQYGRNR